MSNNSGLSHILGIKTSLYYLAQGYNKNTKEFGLLKKTPG